MDILRPSKLTFMSPLAAEWHNCHANSDVYYSKVKPHVESLVKPMFDVVKHVEHLPWPLEPVTYVIGGSEDDWPVTTHVIQESWKTKGSRKQFEKDKELGNIVLRPMLNCKIRSSATPKIVSALPPSFRRFDYSFLNLGASWPGVCRPSWLAFPELECDSFGGAVVVESRMQHNVTTVPVSKSDLEAISRGVQNILDTVQPDQQLVTQVVSEANSATWDIATEIGELPETIKYIMNGIKQGIILLMRLKRDMKQRISKGALTDIASLWMQYRYALMPIVYSINDALDVLGMDARQFQSFRGRKDTPLIEGSTFRGYTIKSQPNINNRVFLKYKYDVDAKIHQGLQINLAATAWELFPLSFVFDWFIQVGDYLTALFAPGVVTQHGCQQSVRCKGSLILEGDSSEVLKFDVDYYRVRIIQPNAFIGINSDVFVSFKRSMDAIALSWLLFKKDKHRG